jgi:flagellar biosynthetic protein FliP
MKAPRPNWQQLLSASHRRAALAAGLVMLAALLITWTLAWGQAEPAPPQDGGLLPDVNLQIGGGDGDAGSLLQIMILFTLVTLAPAILVMVTPFTRIVIILGLLRNAMGTQQTPPNSVLIGLALFMSLFVFMPVIKHINTNAIQPYLAEEIGYAEAFARGQEPIRDFMVAQTRDKDLALFVKMADLNTEEITIDEVPLHVLIPAFMISELKTAFQIGFVIYLPFLVVDMVVSSILMSMGMLMLPPILISLPFKLLMFILADGWNMVFGSILRSFQSL